MWRGRMAARPHLRTASTWSPQRVGRERQRITSLRSGGRYPPRLGCSCGNDVQGFGNGSGLGEGWTCHGVACKRGESPRRRAWRGEAQRLPVGGRLGQGCFHDGTMSSLPDAGRVGCLGARARARSPRAHAPTTHGDGVRARRAPSSRVRLRRQRCFTWCGEECVAGIGGFLERSRTRALATNWPQRHRVYPIVERREASALSTCRQEHLPGWARGTRGA